MRTHQISIARPRARARTPTMHIHARIKTQLTCQSADARGERPSIRAIIQTSACAPSVGDIGSIDAKFASRHVCVCLPLCSPPATSTRVHHRAPHRTHGTPHTHTPTLVIRLKSLFHSCEACRRRRCLFDVPCERLWRQTVSVCTFGVCAQQDNIAFQLGASAARHGTSLVS